MSEKNAGTNGEEKRGINLITVIVVIFVSVFLLIFFITGGIIPAIMTVLIGFFMARSMKKQFGHFWSKDDTDDNRHTEADGKDDEDPQEAATFESMGDAKWGTKPHDKAPIRATGESFENFMLRRFGLTASKAVSSKTDEQKADAIARADDLYDPDQYESVNDDLSVSDPKVLTINGRKTRFKTKSNPFEM